MPITNLILPDHRLVYIDNVGTVTATDVAENYNRAQLEPGAHLVRHVLVDLRRLEAINAYFDGMAAVADMITSDGESQPEPWDVAIVTDNTRHLPLVHGYAAQVRRSGTMRCEVVPTLEKAVSWLGLPDSVVAEIARRRADGQNEAPSIVGDRDGNP